MVIQLTVAQAQGTAGLSVNSPGFKLASDTHQALT